MRLFILLTPLFLLLCSCVSQSIGSSKHTFWINPNTIPTNTNIEIVEGNLSYIDTLGHPIVVIQLEPVVGGRMSFLDMTITEGLPNNAKRIKFLQEGEEIAAYSPNELEKLTYSTIGSNRVYNLPDL